jgi:hypothetical protein
VDPRSFKRSSNSEASPAMFSISWVSLEVGFCSCCCLGFSGCWDCSGYLGYYSGGYCWSFSGCSGWDSSGFYSDFCGCSDYCYGWESIF